jgi:hypothetical protein
VSVLQEVAAMAQSQQASPVRSLLMNTRINVLLQQRGVIIVPQESTVEKALQVSTMHLLQEQGTGGPITLVPRP